MNSQVFSLTLADAQATSRLAASLSRNARSGDTILLEGPVGAGKSHFARAFIRARFGEETEAPSPSFTLVQTYDDGTDTLWHADLYRLRTVDEIAEIGLFDMFDEAICLVEWPDRLGMETPQRYIKLTLTPDLENENIRHAKIELRGNWDWIKTLIIEYSLKNEAG